MSDAPLLRARRWPRSRRWREAALATIPQELKRHLGPVVIRVDEFPDEETEEEMGLESPFDILGLYRGVALPLKSRVATRGPAST